jgi:hypothetical protein
MTDHTVHVHGCGSKIDKAWVAVGTIIAGVALFVPGDFWAVMQLAAEALGYSLCLQWLWSPT